MAKKIISAKVKKIVNEYARRLEKKDHLPIEKVIIFGSHIKGKPHKWSDIDVCIVSPKFRDNFKALEYLWSKRNDQEVKEGLEPVGFSNKDFQKGSSLIKEILETGIAVR